MVIFGYSDNFTVLNEAFKKAIAKAANIWHVILLSDLMEKGLKDLESLVQIAIP